MLEFLAGSMAGIIATLAFACWYARRAKTAPAPIVPELIETPPLDVVGFELDHTTICITSIEKGEA